MTKTLKIAQIATIITLLSFDDILAVKGILAQLFTARDMNMSPAF